MSYSFKKNLKQLLKRKGYLIIFKKILLKNYADYHDFTNTYLHEKALVHFLSLLDVRHTIEFLKKRR